MKRSLQPCPKGRKSNCFTSYISIVCVFWIYIAQQETYIIWISLHVPRKCPLLSNSCFISSRNVLSSIKLFFLIDFCRATPQTSSEAQKDSFSNRTLFPEFQNKFVYSGSFLEFESLKIMHLEFCAGENYFFRVPIIAAGMM